MFSWLLSDKIRIWTIRLLLLVAVCWAAGLMRPTPTPIADVPPLEVRLESLDFGDVVEASNFRHEIPVRNTSSDPMTVRFTKSCDCAGIEPELLRLEPGETGRVVLRLDLLHNRGRYIGQARRPFVAHL